MLRYESADVTAALVEQEKQARGLTDAREHGPGQEHYRTVGRLPGDALGREFVLVRPRCQTPRASAWPAWRRGDSRHARMADQSARSTQMTAPTASSIRTGPRRAVSAGGRDATIRSSRSNSTRRARSTTDATIHERRRTVRSLDAAITSRRSSASSSQRNVRLASEGSEAMQRRYYECESFWAQVSPLTHFDHVPYQRGPLE
jgi:hypothetical protein